MAERVNKLCPVCRRRSVRIPISATVCSVECGLEIVKPQREGRLPVEKWPIVGETWMVAGGPAHIVWADPDGRSFEYVRWRRFYKSLKSKETEMRKAWGQFGVNEIERGSAVRVEGY